MGCLVILPLGSPEVAVEKSSRVRVALWSDPGLEMGPMRLLPWGVLHRASDMAASFPPEQAIKKNNVPSDLAGKIIPLYQSHQTAPCRAEGQQTRGPGSRVPESHLEGCPVSFPTYTCFQYNHSDANPRVFHKLAFTFQLGILQHPSLPSVDDIWQQSYIFFGCAK